MPSPALYAKMFEAFRTMPLAAVEALTEARVRELLLRSCEDCMVAGDDVGKCGAELLEAITEAQAELIVVRFVRLVSEAGA